ncbi:MAG TPA: aminotransferase class V-fold PLP-dependent enzyme [Candidatus Kapabacteria bacterium]|nr:aminotransferase class V-fold PLP-dependent enzyme [Candidatus Kapabacteria bacterium]
MQFGKAIRGEWLLDDDIIFLNHGSFGACPKRVLDVQRGWQEQLEREPVRFFLREMPQALESVKEQLSQFIGAKAEDVVFVENATMGFNAVLRSLAPTFKPGDELLTTSHVYGAIRKTMQYIADTTGAKVVEISVPFPISDAQEVVDAIEAAITPKTRFALIDHITSPTAVIYPLERIIPMLKQRGILVMIDGAHVPGMIDLDIESLGADFYTGNCHKWLFAPKGSAFLWVDKKHQSNIHPTLISHKYKKGYQEEFGWTGTWDPSAWLSIGAGIDFFNTLGAENIRSYTHSLLLDAREKLTKGLDVGYGAPEEMLGMICTVLLPNDPSGAEQYILDLHNKLFDAYHIEVPAMTTNGTAYIRFSTHVYNDASEYDALLAALQTEFRGGVS